MLPVASILVDFDGTACAHDVAVDLLDRFGDPSWREIEEAEERGETPPRASYAAEAAMLTAPLEELVAFVLEHCSLDPTFAPFVGWAHEHDVPVTIVSDGFGFYVPPLLEAAGLDDVRIVTNAWTPGEVPRIEFVNAHPECVGCGTCKMTTVLEARERGPVAFVGDGWSDRFAALYSDLVFAKGSLVGYATADGVPFVPYRDFTDVRSRLETTTELPGPLSPERCPGWRVA